MHVSFYITRGTWAARGQYAVRTSVWARPTHLLVKWFARSSVKFVCRHSDPTRKVFGLVILPGPIQSWCGAFGHSLRRLWLSTESRPGPHSRLGWPYWPVSVRARPERCATEHQGRPRPRVRVSPSYSRILLCQTWEPSFSYLGSYSILVNRWFMVRWMCRNPCSLL